MSIKNRTLYVLKYIWENSDEEHQVTAKDIMAFLNEQGMSATSRTIKADVDQLIECGFDIEINHSTQNRFYMYERHFEMAELKILIDAVQWRSSSLKIRARASWRSLLSLRAGHSVGNWSVAFT